MAAKRQPEGSSAPQCKCGCGQPTNWIYQLGRWGDYLRGHCHRGRARSEYKKRGLASRHPPAGEVPPLCGCGCGKATAWAANVGWRAFLFRHTPKALVEANHGPTPVCACGCGNPVAWHAQKGWAAFVQGHQRYGRQADRDHTRLLKAMAAAEVQATLQSAQLPTPTKYAGAAYQEARRRLVLGRACLRCHRGDVPIFGHHTVLGDDESLVPLCSPCHSAVHNINGRYSRIPRPLALGAPLLGIPDAPKSWLPPEGEQPPLCKCGCGKPVQWKRTRGWATYLKHHSSNAKVPTGTSQQEPPKCGCGCGEPVTFRHGKGWNAYRRGHGQRVLGMSYRQAARQQRELAAGAAIAAP